MNKIYLLVFQLFILLACQQPKTGYQPIYAHFSGAKKKFYSIENKTIKIICDSLPKENDTLFLQVHDAFTSRCYKMPAKTKEIVFEIKDSLSAGMVRLNLWDKQRLIAQDSLQILAEKAYYIDNYLGPKNVPANGISPIMMILVPNDVYGNPLENGTQTIIETNRKNNQIQFYPAEIQQLVSYKTFVSSTNAGKVFVKTKTSNIKGKEKVWEEFANPPANFRIFATDVFPQKSHKRFFYLESDKIYDIYGNLLTDGTLISCEVKMPDQTFSYYKATSINGVINLKIRNPEKAGTIYITSYLSDICKSNTLSLSFQ